MKIFWIVLFILIFVDLRIKGHDSIVYKTFFGHKSEARQYLEETGQIPIDPQYSN